MSSGKERKRAKREDRAATSTVLFNEVRTAAAGPHNMPSMREVSFTVNLTKALNVFLRKNKAAGTGTDTLFVDVLEANIANKDVLYDLLMACLTLPPESRPGLGPRMLPLLMLGLRLHRTEDDVFCMACTLIPKLYDHAELCLVEQCLQTEDIIVLIAALDHFRECEQRWKVVCVLVLVKRLIKIERLDDTFMFHDVLVQMRRLENTPPLAGDDKIEEQFRKLVSDITTTLNSTTTPAAAGGAGGHF